MYPVYLGAWFEDDLVNVESGSCGDQYACLGVSGNVSVLGVDFSRRITVSDSTRWSVSTSWVIEIPSGLMTASAATLVLP
jgi:hypothetical protein